jgi:hypothetical protein
MNDKWLVGQTLRLDLEFKTRDNAGVLVLTTPTTMTVTFVQGTANVEYTLASAQVTANGIGKFIVKHILTVADLVRWRVSSTGAAATAEQGQIKVDPSIV